MISLFSYIPWIYVGISACTAVAVLRQYLDVVDVTNTLPHSLRSDRGTETPMMANAHWQLHRALRPNQDVPFESIYWYGTSTLNQRIESWWRQMSKSQTLAWKVNYLNFIFTLLELWLVLALEWKTYENSFPALLCRIG